MATHAELLKYFEEHLPRIAADLGARTVTAGKGPVTVEMTGQLDVVAVSISPKLLNPDNANELQAALAAAFNDAKAQAIALARDELNPPGKVPG